MANIFIGNLPFSVTQHDIEQLFRPFGRVKYVKLITDRETGRSKGFGFVDLDPSSVSRAIAALHGMEFAGRRLVVNTARSRSQEPRFDNCSNNAATG